MNLLKSRLLYRLAILVEEAFEELLTHPDSALYDVCTLYSKVRNADESQKIRALCRVLVNRVDIFREALESLIRSPVSFYVWVIVWSVFKKNYADKKNSVFQFWELFIENPTLSESSQYENRTSKTLSYCAAVVLYAVVFAFNRLVECPDNMWYTTEDQYLPIICFLAAPNSGNTTAEIRALMSGTYALYSTLVFDASRTSCPIEVAETVVSKILFFEYSVISVFIPHVKFQVKIIFFLQKYSIQIKIDWKLNQSETEIISSNLFYFLHFNKLRSQ